MSEIPGKSHLPAGVAAEPRVDRGEVERLSNLRLLGGMLSAGGEMGIKVKNDHHKVESHGKIHYSVSHSTFPEIGFHGAHAQVDHLKGMFGGSTFYDVQKESPVWKIRGHDAAGLAQELRDFAPSRENEISAMQLWAQTQDAGVRKRLAERLRNETRGGRIVVDKDAYKSLVGDPHFMTGVFEAIGKIPESAESSEEPRIDFVSRNTVLLASLSEECGKDSMPVDQKNRLLTLHGADAVSFLTTIKPYLSAPVSDYVKAA